MARYTLVPCKQANVDYDLVRSRQYRQSVWKYIQLVNVLVTIWINSKKLDRAGTRIINLEQPLNPRNKLHTRKSQNTTTHHLAHNLSYDARSFRAAEILHRPSDEVRSI